MCSQEVKGEGGAGEVGGGGGRHLLRRWDNNNSHFYNRHNHYNNKVSTIIFEFPNISFHFGSKLGFLMFFGVLVDAL